VTVLYSLSSRSSSRISSLLTNRSGGFRLRLNHLSNRLIIAASSPRVMAICWVRDLVGGLHQLLCSLPLTGHYLFQR
jgi:hypothetical protein